jgi:septal ring factor EnvC (AmiA/AmiB activator)
LNPTRGRPALRGNRPGFPRLLKTVRGTGLFLALASMAAGPAQAVDQAQLEALHSRIETLKKNLAGAEENRSEAGDGLRASEQGVSEANRVLHNIGRQQRSVNADLARVREQTKALEAGIAAQQGQLGRLLAMRYATGQQDYLKLLLSGHDPNQTARDLHYYSYVSRAQADFIRALHDNLAGLAQLGRDARDRRAELAELEAKEREGRKELLAQRAERQKVLARLATQIRSQHREIKSLQRDEARLSRLVEELAKVIVPRTPGRRNEKLPESGRETGVFAALKGKLRLPTRGELINRFGTPRSDSGLSWKGLFIRGQSGQEVRAVATGEVVFAEWMRGFGNLMIIDHGQSYLTIYGNNEALLKQVGDTVRAGDAVATVGNSGGNPDSGLYFEIRHQGKAFDPMRWVSLK